MSIVAAGEPVERCDCRLTTQSRGLLISVAAITLLHAALAVWYHWNRSFWGDEWGTLDAINHPYTLLLTYFGNWVTMNYYLIVLKPIHDLLGGTNWLLVMPSLIASCWLIPLVAALALRVGCNARGAALAALLTATNPWLISYAVMIRSYSMFAAFSVAMLVFLYDWRRSGRWRDGILCGVAGALALMSHLTAVYGITAVGLIAAIWTAMRLRKHEPGALARLVRLAIPMTLATGLAVAAHAGVLDDVVRFRAVFSTQTIRFPVYLPTVARGFFGVGYRMVPVLVLLGISVAWAFYRRSPVVWLLIPIVTPIVMMALGRVGNFFLAYARFLTPALPLVFVIIAACLGSLRGRSGTLASGVAVACLLWASYLHVVGLRDYAHSVPIAQLVKAARSVDADAKYVLVGNEGHAFGFKMSGMPVNVRLADALISQPEAASVDLVVIDFLRFTRKAQSVSVGNARVVRYSGAPRKIGTQLIEQLRRKFDREPAGPVKVGMAKELAPLLRWMGDEAGAKEMEDLSNRLAPETRMR